MSDVLVVGAGFAGCVVAERLASAGYRVHVVDRREHIAGNAFDEPDAHGVLVHRFGPHIFHTNSSKVFAYLSRFTAWRPYEHRVLAMVNGQHVPMPINRDTINRLFGLSLDAKGTAAFLDKARVPLDRIRTSEDQLLATVGAELCDLLYRGYSRKFWGLELSELSSSVVARLPVRTSTDDRYFTCRYQAMPVAGYTAMLGHMLGHPRITLQLDTDFQAARERVAYRHLVFTGAIDEFFDFRFGYLPYRSLRFELQHFADTEQHQAAGTVNYPNDFAYTRVTEFRHLTGQQHSGTTIMLEYPSAEGPPYYPVPRPENTARYRRYRQLAGEMPDVTFVGRLARYQYLNMDQVVAAALKTAEAVGRRLRAGQRQSRAAG